MTVSADKDFVPGPVLLLGAPGVGKGTQAQILMQAWGIPQVSTGDLIRDNIRLGTDIGRDVKGLVSRGIFIPDDLVNRMVANRLSQPDAAKGYILDGYPRTLPQAEWLDKYLEAAQVESSAERLQMLQARAKAHRVVLKLPVIAVSIEVRYDELLRRITGRRTGPLSKRIYNIYTNPPAKPGICDVDGEVLVQRPDDTEGVFAERMKAFDELTAPVVEHYRNLQRFEVVNGEQSVEQVTGSIATALKRMRLGAM